MNVTFTIDESLSKKAIVFSFERSGTHFLMNTLEQNFGYLSYPWCNLDHETGLNFYDSEILNTFFNQFDDIKIKNIFKSHHNFDFFKSSIKNISKHFHVFYIYRDPIDVLLSYWSYSKNVNWIEAPNTDTFLKFIKSEPKGAMLRYQIQQYSSILKRWEHHVLGWTNAIEEFNGIIISYNDLNTNFETTVKNISEKLNTPIDKAIRPLKNIGVVQPNNKQELSLKMRVLCSNYINQSLGDTLKSLKIKY